MCQYTFWILSWKTDSDKSLFLFWKWIMWHVHYLSEVSFFGQAFFSTTSETSRDGVDMWQAIRVSRTSSVFLPFLAERFSGFSSLQKGLFFHDGPSISFTYNNNRPLWIRISISLFNWWQSSVWWPLNQWMVSHASWSFPSTSLTLLGWVCYGIILRWYTSHIISTHFALSGVKFSLKLSYGLQEGFIADLSSTLACDVFFLGHDLSCLDCIFSLESYKLFSIFPSSPLTSCFSLFITSSILAADLCATDLLKWPTFKPFRKAPTNISWFRWDSFIVSSLNNTVYSLGDSEGPWRTLNKLVVVRFLLLEEKYCTIFMVRSR